MTGSASRAAELLDITQPAVSRAIAELERSVGFSLFDRSGGRLSPTAEARLLFAEVDRTFVGLDKIRAEAARIRDFGAGAIRIASLSALANTLIPKAIHAFNKRHPGVPVTLQIRASSVVRELVASGSFDLGIAADEVDLIGVHHEHFGSSHALCALPPDHPLAFKDVITPEDMDGRPFVALAPEDKARQRLEAVLAKCGVRLRIIVETPSSSTVCALVLAGVGIGMVNPSAAAGFTALGLTTRPMRPTVEFHKVLLFRDNSPQSRLHRSFIAELRRVAPQFGIKLKG
ncbi:LysR substrate-binding domain-containing protein [Bradyrhizobium barranii subsp. apii]|uniref:LysR substrate-binding domain-containing protein n=1 Tax=Bradyrhizobium barranii subsp. apii TaxID=2819348 RepID=A0A8U0FBS7_9BRAD|nr:LysR substrate-binding domain-containing protein [Bradyrhizobium barranii]UPT84634.1 LysR substrate-binding domain-containing protein [Bradyrhizobium barranii subsp. apii]